MTLYRVCCCSVTLLLPSKLHSMTCIAGRVCEHTLIWDTVEVGGVWDAEADRQQGTLISKDQVLISPGVGGHLAKHQLPLRHLQARLQGKTLQGALELLRTPAPVMHPLCLHKHETTKQCLHATMCKSSQACRAVQDAHAQDKLHGCACSASLTAGV